MVNSIIRKLLTAFIRLGQPLRDNAVFFSTMYILGIVVYESTRWSYLDRYENYWFELFIDLYLCCLVLTLLPSKYSLTQFLRTSLRRIFYFVAYVLAFVDVFCFVQFKSTISPSILLLISETNPQEASGFFSTYITWDLFCSEISLVLLILLFHIAISTIHHNPRNILHKSLWAERIIAKWHDTFSINAVAFTRNCIVSFITFVMFAFGYADSLQNKQLMQRLFSCETIGEVEKDFNKYPHSELYQPIYRLYYSVFSNNLIKKQLGILQKTSDNTVVDSCENRSPEIVLIIGESYNKYHSQLYGYERENTPWQVQMEKTGRLTKFNNVVAPWNLTSFVFKHMLTTYCVGDEGDWCDYPLFPQLFRLAGYEVTFLTNQFVNQAKDEVFDFSGGFFLNDEKLSKAMFDIRNEDTHLWDMDLLKDYERLVGYRDSVEGGKDIKPQRLTIFHLIGQHVRYSIRCPKSKMRFMPDEYDLPDNTILERRNFAYYDNAVWYNDSVVSEIVKRFDDKEAIVIYLPDHGEEVYGPGSTHHCGRTHTTKITKNIARFEYEIPMWIYCTKKYSAMHSDVVNKVKSAANKPYMTDALPHMLLGLAGVKCQYYRPEYDILSPEYNAKRQRLLLHQVDYDKLMSEEK